MKFEFGIYTEITDYAFNRNPVYKESGYTRLFICPDVTTHHLIRVLPGFGKDYEPNDSKIIVENEEITHVKHQKLSLLELNKIIDNDDLSNWDYHVFSSMEEVIEALDEGYGIINLKED